MCASKSSGATSPESKPGNHSLSDFRVPGSKKEEKTLSPNTPFCSIQDIGQLEHIPLVTRLAARSTYELLRETALKKPDALCSLSAVCPSSPDSVITAQKFLGKLHQTANLLADLGIGSQDILALLLPDLFETRLIFWAGQATGIVCPLPTWFSTEQIGELLQSVKAKVLVAPGPQVSQELWQKAKLVRTQVQSIEMILQIRGPGNEQDTIYAFDALVNDYSSEYLCANRKIALDDLAVYVPTKKTTRGQNFTPLTHGHVLYAAWALSLVMTEEPIEMLLQNLSPLLQALR